MTTIELVDLGDLVGRLEIAERAGTTPATTDTWRRRYTDFPAPLRVLSGTPVWLWADVERWLIQTPRQVGRPRSRTAVQAIAPLPSRLSPSLIAIEAESDEPRKRAEGE